MIHTSQILHDLFQVLLFRTQVLIPLLVGGFFLGEFLAQYAGVDRLLNWVAVTAKRLTTKLNRAKRGVATRLYRGMVATGMLVIPAMLLGLLLMKVPLLGYLLLAAIFGRAFATWKLFIRGRKARANTLPLEVPELNYLFADSHAVLRHAILANAEAFAVQIVGTAFWYIVGGLPFAFGYVVLAEVMRAQQVPVFGWASTSLFRVMNFLPHFLAVLLLTLASMFVPKAKPAAVRKAKQFHGVVAHLLHVSLGGALPGRQLPWEGKGTPKLLPEHLARWQLVRLVATVLLLFLLATPAILKILKIII